MICCVSGNELHIRREQEKLHSPPVCGEGIEMDEKRAATDETSLHQAMKTLGAQLEQVSDALDRMERRLDALYDECQRIGAATQRTL